MRDRKNGHVVDSAPAPAHVTWTPELILRAVDRDVAPAVLAARADRKARLLRLAREMVKLLEQEA